MHSTASLALADYSTSLVRDRTIRCHLLRLVRDLVGPTNDSAVAAAVNDLLRHHSVGCDLLVLLLRPHLDRLDLVADLLLLSASVLDHALLALADVILSLVWDLGLDEGHCRSELSSLLQVALGAMSRADCSS